MPLTNPINSFFVEFLTTGVDWEIGTPFPPNIPINIDCYRNGPGYTNYKITLVANVGNTALDVVYFSDGTNTIDFFTKNSGIWNQDVFACFDNLSSLSQGNYPVDIIVTLYGISGGAEILLNSGSVYFDLNVNGQIDNISTDKGEYTLIFDRQSDALSGDLNVNILDNVNNASLGFFNNLEIFKNKNPIINDTFVLEPKTPLATNSNLPIEGEYNISSYIFKNIVGGTSVKLKTFDIQLFVLNSNLLVSPNFLQFTLQQVNSETKFDVVKIINPYNIPFTISGPYWLTFSANSGSGTTNITVTTLNSAILPVGEATGDIVISFGSSSTKIIPVKLNVISFIYLTGLELYNFCLDDKILNFNRRELLARFVRSTLSIKFRTEIETVTMTVPLVVPYFNDKASFDLGKKIHQYFLRLKKSVLTEPKKPNVFDNKVWMYPAEVSILVEELDVDYNVVHTDNVSQIKFYPGKKPKAFPLLSNNLVKQRVIGSKYIFSYIQGLLDTEKISMAAPNALEDGLIVRVKIEDNENKIIFPKKKIFEIADNKQLIYYTIPNNGPQLIHIQYENQNLCPESFFFTGHIKKNPEYSQIYSQSVITSLQEKYDVKKVTIWNINTGFVVKKCVPEIGQIVESRLSYLEFGGVVYRGFFITQKLVEEDSSLELVQFDLEFLLLE